LKDYLDIYALLKSGIDLATMLAAAVKIYGKSFSPQLTLKALSYFGEGSVTELPLEARSSLLTAVSKMDLDCLPSISLDGAVHDS
jgi:hypothetical protein